MLINAHKLHSTATISNQVCIVGAGAAGIALAIKLAQSNFDVLLIESGGLSESNRFDPLFDGGRVAAGSNHPPLILGRRRGIGGTTSVWGGRCIPYDPIDFEKRDYIPNSGWPITYEQLLPYYHQANIFCEAGEFAYDAETAFNDKNKTLIPGFEGEDALINSIERFSCPTNFGQQYREFLKKDRHVSVLYNATCNHIQLKENGKSVDFIRLRTLSGKQFQVHANQYILAMGALETTRLMLASNDVHTQGLGNHSDCLGRYYQCHVRGVDGELQIKPNIKDVIYDYEISKDSIYCRRRITISPQAQRRYKIGNFSARLHYPPAGNPDHESGILSLLFLTKSLLKKEYQSAFTKSDGEKDNAAKNKILWRHAKNIIVDYADVLNCAYRIVTKRFLARQKLPSICLTGKNNLYPLDVNIEQCPNPASRVYLIQTRDVFGIPQIEVDWRSNDIDYKTVKTAFSIIKEEMTRTGCGDLLFDKEAIKINKPIGGHHIGTARMSDNPTQGVVDSNCQVHGIDKLFIGSSAVFPTSSHANPTLTIVALSIRLANHLRKVISP